MDNKKSKTSPYISFAFLGLVSPFINLLHANEKSLSEDEREPELYRLSSEISSDRHNQPLTPQTSVFSSNITKENFLNFIYQHLKASDRYDYTLKPNYAIYQLAFALPTREEYLKKDYDYLCAEVNRIPPEDCRDILNKSRVFITPGMGPIEIAEVIYTLTALPSPQRAELVEFGRSAYGPHMKGITCLNIARETFQIHPPERANVLAHVETLKRHIHKDWAPGFIIQALHRISPSLRDQVVSLSQAVLLPQLNWGEVKKILETIVKLPTARRTSVVQLASLLLTPSLEGNGINDLLGYIAKNYSASFNEIIPLLKPVLTPSMDEADISSLINFAVKVPTNELPLILPLIRSICLEGKESDYCDSFEEVGEIILEIAPEQREMTGANAQHLFTPNMKNYERAEILNAVKEIPFEQQESVIQLSLRLIHPEMDYFDRKSIINEVNKIPRLAQERVISQLEQLMVPEMKATQVISLLRKFSSSGSAQ